MQHAMRVRWVVWGLVVLLLPTSAGALDLRAKLDPLARPMIEDGTVVGIVIGIVKDGETQLIAYGESVKGSGVAPRGDTVFEIGSTSKVFTGVLLADLVEEGVLKLDDPLQKCLPQGIEAPLNGGQPITLRHLATHTSGLPRLPGNLMLTDVSNPYANYQLDDMYAFLAEYEPKKPLGTYEYSNYGMGLLGAVLANHQGTTYEELLVERVAKPLKMRDTCITLTGAQRARLASGYTAGLQPAKNWDLPALAGAGAIRSTADDLLLFLQANLVKKEDARIHRALRLAQREHHEMKDGAAIGLAWHISKDGNKCEHNGMTGGYHAFLSVVPKQKVAVIVLSNTASMEISALGQQVTAVACGKPVKPRPRRKEVDVDRKVLESYTGTYAVVPQFKLKIGLEDGRLTVQATGQPNTTLFAESESKFFLKEVKAEVTFESDDEGRVTHLILHQGGRETKAVREK